MAPSYKRHPGPAHQPSTKVISSSPTWIPWALYNAPNPRQAIPPDRGRPSGPRCLRPTKTCPDMSKTSTTDSQARERARSVDRSQALDAPSSAIKQFNGATRSATEWNSLHRDPDLWYPSGNCLVYLYARGQSQRGPSFKVPFSALLHAHCNPLIEKFISPDCDTFSVGVDSLHDRYTETRHDSLTTSRSLELYIPPPPGANKAQAFAYHLATRNFFAWICRRSLVGEHLGWALAGLISSMRELRHPGAENVKDLIDYMEQEGYLNMRNNPDHALAILHVAETYRLRGMYVDAFAHCTGMFWDLEFSAEYQYTSLASKDLLSRARAELDFRLTRATFQLRTFGKDAFTASEFGLKGGAVSHMERFRKFLFAFYSAKFGRYPPPPPPNFTGMFKKDVYYTMRDDFECLRDLLVDQSDSGTATSKRTTSDKSGIDILHLIRSYDAQWRYETQSHPLPLLPDLIDTTSAWRRMTRLNRGNKLKPDERLLAHASLVKAYNTANPYIIRNNLVQAYRRFEEDLVMSPSKFDKKENLSLPDGRKLRWAIVYAICQVLRDITEAPKEVFDTDDIDYHIAISTESLPPWRTDISHRPETPRRRSVFVENLSPDGATSPAEGPTTPKHRGALSNGLRSPARLGRSISCRAKNLSQNLQTSPGSIVRRPLSIFKTPQVQNSSHVPTLGSPRQTPLRPARPASALAEIPRPMTSASHGPIGNPIVSSRAKLQLEIRSNQHQVQIEEGPMTATSVSSVQESVSSSNGVGAAASSIATSPESSPKYERMETPWSEPPEIPQRRRRDVVSMMPSPKMPARSHMRHRPQSAIFISRTASPTRRVAKEATPDYAMDYAQLVEEQREEIYKGEHTADDKLMPSPLRIKKSAESIGSYNPGDDRCFKSDFDSPNKAMSGPPARRWRRNEL
ncbi:hypothetical protein jhhlp_002117 [Lomentospora prolificans]|uniref:DUF8004 domain-containing protein n=1 Tax=Lomentospora prolificans TaxID=41688 RepID=A0A2N3ND27_9PEZI|nr:hypothetical protein jhhlp_002117 [Lomentospora prolificans]